MKKTLVRAAGVVFAGALIAVAAAPAALAQDDPSTSVTTTSETPGSTSETPAPTSAPSTTSEPATTTSTTSSAQNAPIETNRVNPLRATDGVNPNGDDVTTTTTATTTPEPPYQDNIGHGFVGLGGEGVLVIACAAGAPGNVATANLNVTGGPDQDGADGRLWNYSVRVAGPVTGPTAPFSWTCDGVPGQGVVEFEQAPPTTTTPPTSTSTSVPAGSTAPITTSTTSTTSTSAPGNSSPQAQVKVAPKGGVETGFGGMA